MGSRAALAPVKIRVSRRAQRETDRHDAWWRANRPGAPDLLIRELLHVLELLDLNPNLGVPYDAAHFDGPVRRVLMKRTDRHVYYGRWVKSSSSWQCGLHVEDMGRGYRLNRSHLQKQIPSDPAREAEDAAQQVPLGPRPNEARRIDALQRLARALRRRSEQRHRDRIAADD